MDAINKRARVVAGAGELRLPTNCGRDFSTPEPAAQLELFGLVVGTEDCTTTSEACPRCATAIATIGPRTGPYHAALRCLRGHFLRWLRKPGGVA